MLLVLKTFLQHPPNKTECLWARAADQGWAEGGRGLFVMMVCEAWNIPNWMLMCLLVCLSKQATQWLPSYTQRTIHHHLPSRHSAHLMIKWFLLLLQHKIIQTNNSHVCPASHTSVSRQPSHHPEAGTGVWREWYCQSAPSLHCPEIEECWAGQLSRQEILRL